MAIFVCQGTASGPAKTLFISLGNMATVSNKFKQSIVKLNVGGTLYQTSLSTLTRYPDSMLGRMFAEWNGLTTQNEYFIDFDGPIFKYVLEFLRHGEAMVLPIDVEMVKQLGIAADYFHLDALL